MAVESEGSAELTDEFALVAETAAEAGLTGDALPRARALVRLLTGPAAGGAGGPAGRLVATEPKGQR
jgi:hypothetical protein